MGVTERVSASGSKYYEYGGDYYNNYDDIPFATKQAYETTKEMVGDYFKTEWNKIPEPGQHLLKGAANIAGKAFNYADKEFFYGGVSETLSAVDKGFTAASEVIERETGLYAPTAKVGSELAVDYLLTGGGGKGLKGLKAVANQTADDIILAARRLSPQPEYAYVDGFLNGAVKDRLNSSSTLIPKNMYATTATRTTATSLVSQVSEPLYDAKTTKVNRTSGGYNDLGHQGLSNQYIDPKSPFAQLFNKLKNKQVEGPFKHHHVQDIAFTGKVLNTTDYKEVLQELNKLKIYPGDSPKNIIGMMDEGNLFLQTAKTDLAGKLNLKGYPGFENINNYGDLMRKGNEAQKKLIDDLFKSTSPVGDFDLAKGSRHRLTGELTSPEIRRVEIPLPETSKVDWNNFGLDIKSAEFKALNPTEQLAAKRDAWVNRFNRLGIDRKSIKYDPSKMILSKDHIDKIHYKVYGSSKFKEKVNLLKSIEDGSYYKLSSAEKAQKIAEVYRIQKNVSINVAKERLKLIKNHLKETQPIRYRDIYSKDPNALRTWIIDNSGTAGNLGWKDGIPDYRTLTREPGKISPEFQTIFSTEIK